MSTRPRGRRGLAGLLFGANHPEYVRPEDPRHPDFKKPEKEKK